MNNNSLTQGTNADKAAINSLLNQPQMQSLLHLSNAMSGYADPLTMNVLLSLFSGNSSLMNSQLTPSSFALTTGTKNDVLNLSKKPSKQITEPDILKTRAANTPISTAVSTPTPSRSPAVLKSTDPAPSSSLYDPSTSSNRLNQMSVSELLGSLNLSKGLTLTFAYYFLITFIRCCDTHCF